MTSAMLADTAWERWSTHMHLVVTASGALDAARREVDAELDTIEAAASRFRPDSEITALTRSAGRPTEVSQVLADLLAAALAAADLTDGDVDPTVGAALIRLGYDSRDSGYHGQPAPGPVVTATIPARWSMVTLRDRIATVPAGVVLDLGATAKAVAADRCAERVHQVTGSGVLVNLGGDIATAGPAPDGHWPVLVADDDADPASSIGLPAGAALATSSTVRRRWRHRGITVHHILDPRTGRSAVPVWRTVSVVAPSCLEANTVSTAAVVRGRRAPSWIAGLGMPARLVDQNSIEHPVGGWPTRPGTRYR